MSLNPYLLIIDYSKDHSATVPMSKKGDKGMKGDSTNEAVIQNVKFVTQEDKNYQPESNLDSTTL